MMPVLDVAVVSTVQLLLLLLTTTVVVVVVVVFNISDITFTFYASHWYFACVAGQYIKIYSTCSQ